MNDASEEPLRRAASREVAEEWALVLLSAGVPVRVRGGREGFSLSVAPELCERAEAILAAFRDRAEFPGATIGYVLPDGTAGSTPTGSTWLRSTSTGSLEKGRGNDVPQSEGAVRPAAPCWRRAPTATPRWLAGCGG